MALWSSSECVSASLGLNMSWLCYHITWECSLARLGKQKLDYVDFMKRKIIEFKESHGWKLWLSLVFCLGSFFVKNPALKLVKLLYANFSWSSNKTIVQKTNLDLMLCMDLIAGTAFVQRSEEILTNGWSAASRSISYERFVPSSCNFCNVRAGAA